MTIFLIKTSIFWGFFALLYSLLLRHETFFRANRIYLLGALALGLLLAGMPAEQISTTVSEGWMVVDIPVFTVGLTQVEIVANKWQNIDVLWGVYWIGFSFMLVRVLWGLIRLFLDIGNGHPERQPDGIRLIRNGGIQTPYSFFHWIFIPDSTTPFYESRETRSMLAHERAHAHGWHSADVLFSELLCVVFWFHPLVYWYKRALRTIHEYLADSDASRFTDKKQYGLLLIMQSQSGIPIAFANHFFQSPLKQRLVMLTKKTSSPVRALKFGFVLPAALLFAFLFRQAPAMAQTTPNQDATGKVATKSANPEPEFPGGMSALAQYLTDNIKYPESAKIANAEGTVVLGFVVMEDGSLTNIEEVKTRQTVHAELTAEAIRVVSMMPKWKPAIQDGKVVKMKFNLPIRFKLDQEPSKELFEVDKLPEFPGGEKQMAEFLGKNIQYPADARKAGASGLVAIQFIVEADGSPSSFQVLSSPRPDFTEEAIRVLKLLPKFNPGMKDGKAVRVRYTLPIRFSL